MRREPQPHIPASARVTPSKTQALPLQVARGMVRTATYTTGGEYPAAWLLLRRIARRLAPRGRSVSPLRIGRFKVLRPPSLRSVMLRPPKGSKTRPWLLIRGPPSPCVLSRRARRLAPSLQVPRLRRLRHGTCSRATRLLLTHSPRAGCQHPVGGKGGGHRTGLAYSPRRLGL